MTVMIGGRDRIGDDGLETAQLYNYTLNYTNAVLICCGSRFLAGRGEFEATGKTRTMGAALLLSALLSAAARGSSLGVGLSCAPLSSTALNVSFPCVDATDLYWVAIFGDEAEAEAAAPKPAAIVTTTSCSAVLDDLLPSTGYYLRVRSHPAAAPSTVWGWRNYSAPAQRCATAAPPALTVQRRGELQSQEIGLQWRLNAGHQLAHAIAARWRRIWPGNLAAALQRPTAGTLSADEWAGHATVLHTEIDSSSAAATATGLAPGASYAVVLQGRDGAALSDPVRFRTAAIGSSYETVYRVAEETHEIDLLLNHNAGDLKGEAAFLRCVFYISLCVLKSMSLFFFFTMPGSGQTTNGTIE